MSESQFQSQLLTDLEELQTLIVRYARGDRSVLRRRQQLEGAVQVKFAVWKAIREHEDTQS